MRLTEAEAAQIDEARAGAKREWWIRTAALAAAREQAQQQKAKRNPKNCKHEGMRLAKGVCPDCQTWAVKK